MRLRAPGVDERLAAQVAAATEHLRRIGLYKPPGIAETIDWARSLQLIGVTDLTTDAVTHTLGSLLKYREDHERVGGRGVDSLVESVLARLAV